MTDANFIYESVDGRGGDHPVLADIYRLRYQVYVSEWGFERPEDHPTGMECDEYDRHAVHFCARSKNSTEVIGTARIILGSDLPFPIERHFELVEQRGVRRGQVAEISRLAISKNYRRRAIDRVIFSNAASNPDDLSPNRQGLQNVEQERRKCEHELILGLYLMIYRESLRLGLTHWYAVMARGLCLILHRWGIDFRQIGPERDYHGLRAPYLLEIAVLRQSLMKSNPDLALLAGTCV